MLVHQCGVLDSRVDLDGSHRRRRPGRAHGVLPHVPPASGDGVKGRVLGAIAVAVFVPLGLPCIFIAALVGFVQAWRRRA